MQIWRKISFPFSLIYGSILTIRHFLYDHGILRSIAHDIPLICIGNLSFGGTGKTPMTEYLIRLLKDDYRVAVLSRGYKRTSRGFHLANKNTSVAELGDEPYQYFRKFPDIYVAVDANRNRGVANLAALSKPPEVILLDDAFQHRKIRPGFHILLTSYTHLYPKDFLFPTGMLRDLKRRAKEANHIIVSKSPLELPEETQLNIKKQLKPLATQQIFFTSISYETVLRSAKEKIPVNALRDEPFTLVTGIANPEPLVRFLTQKKFQFQHLKYPDHHFFSEKDISMLKQKKRIVTTEKDYVRLQHRLNNLCYLAISTTFLEHQSLFINEIRSFIVQNLNKS